MSNALIIVDLQNAFLEGGEIQVCDNVNDMLKEIDLLQHNLFFDHIIATQHVYPTKKFHDRETLVKNTYGAQLNDIIDKTKINLIITKQTYSAFDTDNNLVNYLNNNKIKTLYICGLSYDCCVYKTAKSAHNLGFNVKILKYSTKSYEKNTCNIDNYFKNNSIQIINSAIELYSSYTN